MNDALFVGTFDPPTNRHLWMVANGSRRFDRIVLAVRDDGAPRTMFTIKERGRLLNQCFEGIEIVGVGKELPAVIARANGCRYMLRRMPLAHEYQAEVEFQRANHDREPGVPLVYLVPDPEYRDMTSLTVRDMVGVKGWKERVKQFVPVATWEGLMQKFGRPGEGG